MGKHTVYAKDIKSEEVTHQVRIEETLATLVNVVGAKDADEAYSLVRDAYRNYDIVLESDDFVDSEFEVVEDYTN